MAEKTQTRRGPLGWVKRHKKLTIFLVIVLVAALVLVNVLGKTDKAAAGSYQFVRTTVLTKTTLSDTVSVTGTVKAGSSASVTASDSVKTYKVTAVNVAVGDTVRKGDVIATLDTTDVEKQIANAQLQLSDTRTDARKNYTQAVEDQETNLATAQENLDKAQKNYDTLGMDDYYTSMASAANSGKTNREIVTDWYTRYAEEIAGYENTLANLNIQPRPSRTATRPAQTACRARSRITPTGKISPRASAASRSWACRALTPSARPTIKLSSTARRWNRRSSPIRTARQARTAAWTTPRRSSRSPSARMTP